MNQDKEEVDRLAIRAKPRPVRRFNRRALIAICGATGIFILSAAAIAFRDDSGSSDGSSPELFKTSRNILPDQITAMPADYSDIKPKLGPPLPGDLGPAFIGQPSSLDTPQDNPFQYQGAPTQTTAQPAPVDAALGAPLFFVQHDNNRAGQTQAAITPPFTPSLDQFNALPLQAQAQGGAASQTPFDQNRQDRKEAFLTRDADSDIYNPNRLQTPISPYQVMETALLFVQSQGPSDVSTAERSLRYAVSPEFSF